MRIATRSEAEQQLAAGETPSLFPLALALEGCFTEEQMNANFFATLDRGYTPLNGLINKFSGACSVVGSGPSIRETYKELRGDVLSINGALKFLLEKGIVPRWHMIWDCDPVCENFAVPHPDVHYLIASRAHPKVFEKLKGCNVTVWHAAGDLNIVEIMRREEVISKQSCEEPLLNGGTAGITRGMYLAMTLGYTEIDLFGADSSYSEDGHTHAMGSLVKEKDIMVAIGNNPPFYFRTTPEWCAQVEEYRAIYAIFTCLCKLTLRVHGNGMLPKMHEILDAQRAHMGDDGFWKHVSEGEKQRQEMTKAANEQYEKQRACA